MATTIETGPEVHLPPETGLSQTEATRRLVARGRRRAPTTSRSYASIVRANVLTVFNLILAVFGALTVAFGDWRDALFLGILVANSAIGILQEARAKRALDRLAALVAPTATVVRDGTARTVAIEEVVPGDLVRLAAGDQVVADGRVTTTEGLSLDESILTGESLPVTRDVGDELRSGSFAAEGSGSYVVEAVGPDSYAERITGEARRFRHPRSPLERAQGRLLYALVGLMVVLGALLGYALAHRHAPVREAIATATAGVVSMVPEGLILLTSLTFAVGALRMTRRGVLAQQLNAIESLAAVDVLCTDKTGTLTESSLAVGDVIAAPGVGDAELKRLLAAYAASSPARNLTLTAIAEAYPAAASAVTAQVPFSSRRRWSAIEIDGDALALGAPELFSLGPLARDAARETAAGRRVLALARIPGPLEDHAGDDGAPPSDARALGLVVLAERLRADARHTVEFLVSEGVQLKVLSGDAPETVAAIAAAAGVPLTGGALDGRALPTDPDEFRDAVLRAGAIGRISPEDKRRVIEALRDAGKYVAMIGDGVNDVPALKAARLAIAQGSGTQMARSVADVVLVRGDFSAIPAMVAEGRQMLRNLQRVAKLYVTKSSFAAFLILTIGTTSTAYPLLPRHFTLSAALTIGIPSFFLALAPSSGPWRSRAWARDVARFAMPAGTTAGIGVVASYLVALNVLDLGVVPARTVATTVLVIVGLYLILVLEAAGWRRRATIGGLCLGLLALHVAAVATPASRAFFELAPPSFAIALTSIVGAALAVLGLYLAGFAPGEPAGKGGS